MKQNLKFLSFLFLNMIVHQVYGSYNNNRKNNFFNHSNNNNRSHQPSAFFPTPKETRNQIAQRKTFDAINEAYRQQLVNTDYCITILSSTIALATQKAQSMGLHKQNFCEQTIYQHCQNQGYYIIENIINSYLEYIQNNPNNFKDILENAYQAGKSYQIKKTR